MNIINKAAGILIKDKKLLVGKPKGKDAFISPGGKLEPGEDHKQALIRELKEEFDVTVNESDLEEFGVFTAAAANDPRSVVNMTAFLVKTWQGEIRPSSEIEQLLWIDSSDLSTVTVGSIFGHDIIPKLKEKNLIE